MKIYLATLARDDAEMNTVSNVRAHSTQLLTFADLNVDWADCQKRTHFKMSDPNRSNWHPLQTPLLLELAVKYSPVGGDLDGCMGKKVELVYEPLAEAMKDAIPTIEPS